MAQTIGFELCEEDHVLNTEQWNRQQRSSPSSSVRTGGGRRFAPVAISEVTAGTGDGRASAANGGTSSAFSRMRDFFGRGRSNGTDRSLASSRYDRYRNRGSYRHDDDESTASSRFSDDSGASSGTTYSEQRRRKRKCAMRMMCAYICLAGSVFLGVVLWRMGLIFKDVDDSMTAVKGYSNSDGYDELGRMVCNGLTLNCHRRANEIMYATVHNAMSSREHSFLAYNNLLPLEDALMAGFRGLTLDSCDCSRVGIQLCHGLCIAGFRRPVETFTAIVQFMQQNPHEVVIIELQVGDESLEPLFDELRQVEGLFDLLYDHPGGGEKWPKLKDMIEMDKRLIFFAHNDLGCEEHGECPAGVLPTFDFAFETPFSQRSATALMDVDETCSVSRGWSDSDFIISNHFATNDQGLPDLNVARVTNAALNLQLRLDACQNKFSSKYGQEVINLLVVDFWNIGDTLDVVYKYNSALPAMTEAPSESPSSFGASPQPTISSPPTGVGSEGTSSRPSSFPSVQSVIPTNAPVTKQTQTPSNSPSTTPSLSLESLLDIIYEPETPSNLTAPTTNDTTNDYGSSLQLNFSTSTSPTFSENVDITLAPTPGPVTSEPTFVGNVNTSTLAPTFSGSSESLTLAPNNASATWSPTLPPSLLDETGSATSPPTFGSNASATTTAPSWRPTTWSPTWSPTIPDETWNVSASPGNNEAPTWSPTRSPTDEAVSTSTPPPSFDSTKAPTWSPTRSPTDESVSTTTPPPSFDPTTQSAITTTRPTYAAEEATNTPAPTFAATPAPTFGPTEQESSPPEVEKEQPDVEKEHPDDMANLNDDIVVSSGFGNEAATTDPTPEYTIEPTDKDEGNDSHSVFAIEKDPSP